MEKYEHEKATNPPPVNTTAVEWGRKKKKNGDRRGK